MKRPPDNPTRSLAVALVLAVGCVGHGLHGWFGLRHGCGPCCRPGIAAGETAPEEAAARLRANGPRQATTSADACPLCALLAGFRSTPPAATTAVIGATPLTRLAASPDRSYRLAPLRRPPTRGPPTPRLG